ncbi:8-amino-7-oxononanoate synthase [Moniliophthora roreri MCA 2997]|uniref:8-amino-7-oxononanoate synthase n=2 Tax=Moniliophthora roreri TaxID=221103 RepID=V2WFE3_MONRO|nr:8-amino-7-oxononanoate synthase [Moniliophthora roreri MCA 2997]KAI3615825.1 8-amino-7-oxononanoate synthase [Moniliophthora roreri]
MSAVNILNITLEEKLESRTRRNVLLSIPDPATPASYTYFTSNDFLSLSNLSTLHAHLLETLNCSPHIVGAGGSRLLVNTEVHDNLENRLSSFFGHEKRGALLFNSGYDANVGLFSAVPQPGDVIVYDEYIHASVHDGLRHGCRAEKQLVFAHNSLPALRRVLESLLYEEPTNGTISDTSAFRLKTGRCSLFLAVESLYSMEGSVAPLRSIIEILEELFPLGNAYMIVDEAHATGVYGPQGRGRVALEGLEGHPRILARLCTFGKALAAGGAVVLTTPLVAKYLTNYARPLIYTTTLPRLSVIAASCSFDMLEDGTAERQARQVLATSRRFVGTLSRALRDKGIRTETLMIAALPDESEEADLSAYSPIVALVTPLPMPPNFQRASPAIPPDASPAVDLSVHLRTRHNIVAHSISFPTIPKGKERVRICLNAKHTTDDIDRLVKGVVEWAKAFEMARNTHKAETIQGFEIRSRL